MRVAYITRTTYGVLGGGASYFFPEKISQFAEVMVIAPTPKKSNEKVIMPVGRVRVCSVPAGQGEDALYQVYRLLADFRPDVVHVFHSPNCLFYVKKLKCLLPGAKWVLDFRSPPIISAWRDRIRVRFRYFACQMLYDHIFTHSHRTIGQNLPLRIRRVREVCPGVELASIGGRRGSCGGSPERFVYIGSVTASRRLDILVDAFIAWSRQLRKPVRLDIYGAGNALDELRARVSQAGGESSVVFHGAIDQQSLLEKLPSYDVGVAYVPDDLFAKAPSLKSLEYAAAGIRILASDTVGHRDYAKRFGFQFAFFRNDIRSIVAALDRIYCEFESLSDPAVNLRCVERFDWSSIVRDQLLPAYKEMTQHD